MIEIKLWKPCMDCEHADVLVREDQYTYASKGVLVNCCEVTCSHAEVCFRINGADPFIGGDADGRA